MRDDDWFILIWTALLISTFVLLGRRAAKRRARERLQRQQEEERRKLEEAKKKLLRQQEREAEERSRKQAEDTDRLERERVEQERVEQERVEQENRFYDQFRIVHSPNPPSHNLYGYHAYKEMEKIREIIRIEEILGSLKPLPDSERAKLVPEPKDKRLSCRTTNKRDTISMVNYHRGFCYDDRIEFHTDHETQFHWYEYLHCVYKLDDDKFITTEREWDGQQKHDWKDREEKRFRERTNTKDSNSLGAQIRSGQITISIAPRKSHDV